MARVEKRLSQNLPGEFFVDESCIDCATCRRVSPASFGRVNEIEKSYVFHQPESEDERLRALMALVACPTASIGTEGKADVSDGVRAFPERIDEGLYYCGFTSESSFGASSYFLARSGGNVLVDSPRAAAPLLRRIEEMGGVRYLFLTHRDDVADHEKLQARFGCERVMHEADIEEGTEGVERKVSGRDPVPLADDLLVIPLPGHTQGSAGLLFGESVLFTGDHLWWSDRLGRLHASRNVCWYSWPEQIGSMKRLLDHRFEWILPGHGNRHRAASPEALRSDLEKLIERMRW